MDLIDPHTAPEIFCDGIDDVRIIEGIVRGVLFSRQNGIGVIVARFAIPAPELPDIIQSLVAALARSKA